MGIVEFVKHYATNSQDMTGEYNSSFCFEFILPEACNFEIYGQKHLIDRIRMDSVSWGDECDLVFANEKEVFSGIRIPLRFIRMIYKRILIEQKRGKLRGWCFDDVIRDYYEQAKKEE
jgi:hypothetical protein